MSWTYTPGNVGTVDRDWIRLQVGDTDTSDQLLSNEELDGILTREARRDLAAVRAAEEIAAKFSRFGSQEVSRAYATLADRLNAYLQISSGTWSYSGNPASSPRNMVRFLIGDIEQGDQQINDAEIDAILAVEGRPHFAAATCARTLSINYALHRKAEKAQYYGALAAQLELHKEIHAGAWTYSGDPNASALDKVRFLVGDVNPDSKLLNNAEITEALQDEPRPHFAAARCAEALAARFATQIDAGAQSVRSSRYLELAKRLKDQAELVQTGAWTYNAADTETARNWVRLRIGDADLNRQLLNDAELDSFIALGTNRAAAAAAAAKSLAARYGSMGDEKRSKHFADLSADLYAEGGPDYL